MGRPKIKDKRICLNCQSTTTNKNWHKYQNDWLCSKCYCKKWRENNPNYAKNYFEEYYKINHDKIIKQVTQYAKNNRDKIRKYNAMRHPKRLMFIPLNKRITLEENPRKGICQQCAKKIGDEYIDCFGKIAVIKRTHIHHIQYHNDDPLRDTIELCVSCHIKTKSKSLMSVP